MKVLPLAVLIVFFTGTAVAVAAENPPYPPAQPEAIKRWQDMRFGMFIHWGPVSLTGAEIGWSRGRPTPIEKYDNLYKEFNPTKFDADAWVKVAKEAGMKYMVLTTKHHDGFCLWDTKQTDYNIMNSPFKRDVVKELSEACKKQGMGFGAYYSVTDWYHPDHPCASDATFKEKRGDLDAYNKFLLAQIEELITNYGPLTTIWTDNPQSFAGRGAKTINLARSLQPDILMNDRTEENLPGDYNTPEQRIGEFNMTRPWESCMTVSAQGAWAWAGANDGVKSLEACLSMLIRGAGGDGNVLLNVGPRPDGVIDPAQANRLKEVGDWLKKNGESIYGTRGGPFKPGRWGVSTRKENKIYVHVFNWAGDWASQLPAIPAKIKSAKALNGAMVTFKQSDEGISLGASSSAQQEIDTVIVLELESSAMDLAPVDVSWVWGKSLTFGAHATASNLFQKDARWGADKAVDDNPDTRWATDFGTIKEWLEVDLGKPQEFSRVLLMEWGDRTTSFELQYKVGEEWKTIFKGDKIGQYFRKSFPPVTAQVVRLNFIDGNAPTIEEFQLLK